MSHSVDSRIKMSLAIRAKISAANKGKIRSQEQKARISEAHKGKYHGKPAMTPEEKLAASRAAALKYYRSEHGREKIRQRERKRSCADARTRDAGRRKAARDRGYHPGPREKECAPRPPDGLCDCCLTPVKQFVFDHCHRTGVFRGWICSGCNTGHGMSDDIERLQARIDFLLKRLPWQ